MRNVAFILLAGILISIYACTYSESGIYHVDPVPGDPPEIWMTTNLDTLNTPSVTDSLEVVYEVEITNGKFYQLQAFVREQMIYNSDSIKGAFWIDTTVVEEPGIDTLSLYLFFSTNSNSLADIVELEYDFFSTDYPINFEQGGVK